MSDEKSRLPEAEEPGDILNLSEVDASRNKQMFFSTYGVTLDEAEYERYERIELKNQRYWEQWLYWTFLVNDKYVPRQPKRGRKLYTCCELHSSGGLGWLKRIITALDPSRDLTRFNLKTDPQELVGKSCVAVVMEAGQGTGAWNDIYNLLPITPKKGECKCQEE